MKKSKIILILFILIVISSVFGFISFFLYTEAPFTKGNVLYNVDYNHNQSLDIYFPTQEVYELRPVLFYIHGGAWIGGTKEAINLNRFNGAINDLRDSGFVVVSPTYTLGVYGKSPFPQNIKDVYEAIDFIKRNADLYQLDSSQIGILGESAGAHIAMMLAFAEPGVYKLNKPKHEFDYLVDVYGPNELRGIYQSGLLDTINASMAYFPNSIQNRLDLTRYLLGFNPREDSARAFQMMDEYSPIKHLSDNYNAPTLIIQGKEDRLVPFSQSQELKKKLNNLNLLSELYLLNGVDHAFLNASDAQKDSIQRWIREFVIRDSKVEEK